MTILLVEDDERIVEFVQRGLRAEGYTVEVARDGDDGLEFGRSEHFTLIILDLMLPGKPGQEVCQELRAAGVKTPIIMLTAMDALEDRVEGLRLGADDYLTKPFAFTELVARIEALHRRSRDFEVQETRLVVGDLVFDRETLEVSRAGKSIDLTAKELALLELLMNTPGKVLSRTRILQNAWGLNADPLTNVVDVYIRRLRAKIDQDHPVPLIKTVRGYGYKIDTAAAASCSADDV